MFFKAGKRRVLAQKLGWLPAGDIAKMNGKPRFWVHAVSMGEVSAIHPLLRGLRGMFPNGCIMLSTGTESGQKIARERVPEANAIFYFILDLPFIMKRMMRELRPDVCILAETELWPNFLKSARVYGARTMLANGRISDRSYERYRKTRFFWMGVLDYVNVLSMIRAEDGERAIRIGANPVRVFVNGNCKFDQAFASSAPEIRKAMKKLLALEEGDRVLVAGSTHEGEEEAVINAFLKIRKTDPGMILVLVPRHIERCPRVGKILAQSGLQEFILRSHLEREGRGGQKVVLWDTFGELSKVYSIATLVFCGGSLVPRRGQNILEPAAWGKVVLYGPSMEDFQDAHTLLQGSGAGLQVQNEDELARRCRELLAHPQELIRRGEAGKEATLANCGATAKNLELVSRLIA
ncbi:MAG: 3-deoxy-D-manno-octulosonic acid transferase [Deltaproteobacteria bacterium]|nr:3-deoxy-D-manno-octulosonic acid transferase [Deltaproteobacteria bacterium]